MPLDLLQLFPLFINECLLLFFGHCLYRLGTTEIDDAGQAGRPGPARRKDKGRPSCDDRPEYILALPWATGSAGGPWLSLRRLVRMSR